MACNDGLVRGRVSGRIISIIPSSPESEPNICLHIHFIIYQYFYIRIKYWLSYSATYDSLLLKGMFGDIAETVAEG